ALGEDIKASGLKVPIVLIQTNQPPCFALLDGRNRLDAMEAVGIDTCITSVNGIIRRDRTKVSYTYAPPDCDPAAHAISANIHRRHLNAEQKREVIAKLLKVDPSKSDRQIASTVKASPTTVGTVRAKMETTGDVSKLDTRQDTKGRKQPAKRK